MTFIEELNKRRLIEHFSAPLEKVLGTRRTVYWGVDPSADSMHVGNLAVVLLMKRIGDAGHKLVFLVGGGTGMIGDPKEQGERPMLDAKTVKANTRALKKQLRKILGTLSFTIVDNANWLMTIKLVPFLRDIGKYFTVNDLIKREIIRKRLETPDENISYTEFTYTLLQGFDYLTLHQKYNVDLQISGTDQWTNALSGVDLIHKKLGKDVYAFTTPIVTDATGKKFGKSEGNAIWLDPKKTSPFRFYQFWVNLPDTNMENYLNVYTFLPSSEIEILMKLHQGNPGERQAQKMLARIVTEIVHGPAAAATCAAASDALFSGISFQKISHEALSVVLAEAPSVKLHKSQFKDGFPLAEALVTGGLASSKSNARRLIEGDGITLSGQPIKDPDQKIYLGDLANGYALVRKGKQGVLVLILK